MRCLTRASIVSANSTNRCSRWTNEQRILSVGLFVNRIELRSAPAVINVRVKTLSGAKVKKKGGLAEGERRLNKVVC